MALAEGTWPVPSPTTGYLGQIIGTIIQMNIIRIISQFSDL